MRTKAQTAFALILAVLAVTLVVFGVLWLYDGIHQRRILAASVDRNLLHVDVDFLRAGTYRGTVEIPSGLPHAFEIWADVRPPFESDEATIEAIDEFESTLSILDDGGVTLRQVPLGPFFNLPREGSDSIPRIRLLRTSPQPVGAFTAVIDVVEPIVSTDSALEVSGSIECCGLEFFACRVMSIIGTVTALAGIGLAFAARRVHRGPRRKRDAGGNDMADTNAPAGASGG